MERVGYAFAQAGEVPGPLPLQRPVVVAIVPSQRLQSGASVL
jgi:hypothetical protein